MRLKGRKQFVDGLKIGFCLAFTNWVIGVGIAEPQEPPVVTPRQIVEQWLQVYPGQIDQAAELTTAAFREGVSKEEWIATQGSFLKNLGMKYVRAKVVHEELVGQEIHIMVHAHIVTLMDDHPQDELYILVPNSNGGWLINQVEVYTESFNRFP